MNLILSIIGLVALLLLAGCVYQRLGERADRRRYTQAGRWIKIGNARRIFIVEKGSGGATVLFEAGIAATHLNWLRIQEQVAKFASTMSYDRMGLGWSSGWNSPCKTARTPANIVPELHEMLVRAGIKSPYILVGHSFGCMVMRRFALEFPDEVTSMVLVDPMRCEEWPPLNAGKQVEIDRGIRLSRFAVPLARIGIIRLAVSMLFGSSGKMAQKLASSAGDGGQHVLERVKNEVGKMPRELWPIVAAHWSRPACYAGMRRHVEAVPDTVREMMNAEPIREIPILILTPEKSTPLSDEELGRIGNNVRQVIAPACAHWIHLDQPDLVIDSIREMVTQAPTRPTAQLIP